MRSLTSVLKKAMVENKGHTALLTKAQLRAIHIEAG